MNQHFEKFARQLAQDAIRHTGELIIDLVNDQIPLLKPSLETLQDGTRRYPKTKIRQSEKKFAIAWRPR
ncbi:MAG: hypothetical protein HC890_11000 [Chloroflexaceae bacterium]|nr:hypothetical protein [Chloroflexaceae bacterium]